MADDIVTRLREKYSGQLPICSEAADEIERLRKEVGHLQFELDHYICECHYCLGEEGAT